MSRQTDIHNLKQMAEHLQRTIFYMRQLTDQDDRIKTVIVDISGMRERVLKLIDEVRKVKND